VNSRDVYTAIVNNHDTISMGEETSFLFISSEASQKLTSPYPNPQHHQQNIDSENFIYYGREHRSMYVAPNIDEDTCDEDEEDEEEWEVREHGRFPCSRLGKSEVSRKMRNRVVLVHGSIGRLVHKPSRNQTINYELPANNYESQLRKRLRQINYRCEECGNLYPMYAIRVEHAHRRLLCVSCGHDYGLENI